MSLSREEKIRLGFSKEMRILEVGPSYNPIVPKRDGWKVFIVDHASRDDLIKKYITHPDIDVNRIEDVDFVWSGENLDALVPADMHGTFDACVASHVIEHIPDLVSFFVALSKLLVPGGVIALAIPDKRFCFDYFRPHSTTGSILDAHREGGVYHRPSALFDHIAYFCKNDEALAWGQEPIGAISLSTPMLSTAWQLYLAQPAKDYVDCHGWQFTPSSFELIVLELAALGLIDFHIVRSFPTVGFEFIVQLQQGRRDIPSGNELNLRRIELLERIVEELGQQADYLRARGRAGQPLVVRNAVDHNPPNELPSEKKFQPLSGG